MTVAAEPDVVVVGAGAAGLAAAHELLKHKLTVAVLEARRRVGGRAWTVHLEGHPADLGCGWLHSADRNPWVQIAAGLGLEVNRRLPDWGFGLARERQLDEPAARDRDRAFRGFWRATADGDGPDRALAEILPASDPWLPNFNAVTSFIAGAEPALLSRVDLARYRDSGINWRVVEGYGRLIERFGASLPVTLDAAAQAIDWGGRQVEVTTRRGRLRCRAVVLTVPASLLAEDAIRFTPPLPAAKLAAAARLPMGRVTKLMLAVDGQPFDIETDRQALGSLHREQTAIYHLQPLGRPQIEAYWGGTMAAELERAGPATMADFAIGELASLFGSGVRGCLRPLLASGWAADPYARGAYSYASPGGADGRAVLAQPVGGCLFFAGEACSRDSYSTAHGAYQTGIAAARAAVAQRHS